MGSKRSKKKRDAARRAAEQSAADHNGGPTPPAGPAQGKQEAAGREAELWQQHDENLVMLFLSDTCMCTRKQSLAILLGIFLSRS